MVIFLKRNYTEVSVCTGFASRLWQLEKVEGINETKWNKVGGY